MTIAPPHAAASDRMDRVAHRESIRPLVAEEHRLLGRTNAPETRRKVQERLGCISRKATAMPEGCSAGGSTMQELQLESSGAPMCVDDEIKVVDISDREVRGEAGGCW